jgi:hypothetical protein
MVKLPNVRGILSFREEGRPDKKMMATIHPLVYLKFISFLFTRQFGFEKRRFFRWSWDVVTNELIQNIFFLASFFITAANFRVLGTLKQKTFNSIKSHKGELR